MTSNASLSYRSEPAGSFQQVSSVAAQTGIMTCIRDVGQNHSKAQDTWQQYYPRSVVYYIIYNPDQYETPVGYVRLLRVTESDHLKPQTWVADFARPMDYEAILSVGRVFPHTLLVKRAENQPGTKYQEFAATWDALTASFPTLNKYPYHVQQSQESVWLLVPKSS